MFFPPHYSPPSRTHLLPSHRKCGQPLQGLLPPQTASWPAHNQWLLKLGISSANQFSQAQDNSDVLVLLQSSLLDSKRFCGACIAVQFLSVLNPVPQTFPSQVLILNKFTVPQTLSQHLPPLNPTYNKHLLCFSGRHPNHKLPASPGWYPVHPLINFPSADYALVLPEVGYFLWEQENLRD